MTKKLLRNHLTNISQPLLRLFLDGRTIVRHNQTKETTCPHVLNVPHLSEQDVFKVARPSTFVGTPSIFESLIP